MSNNNNTPPPWSEAPPWANLQEKTWSELCEMDDRFASFDEYPIMAQECQARSRVFAKELDRIASDFGEVLDMLTTVLQEIKITIANE